MSKGPEAFVLFAGMDHLGAIIGVNPGYAHSKGRAQVKPGVRVWRDRFAESLSRARFGAGLRDRPLAPPPLVPIDREYRNEAEATDPNNLCRLANDAVQAATGANDGHMQPETGTVTYGATIPRIGTRCG